MNNQNIWQFLNESVDDVANVAIIGLAVTGGAVWLAYDAATNALRPVFGQDAPTVAAAGGIALTAGGVMLLRNRGAFTNAAQRTAAMLERLRVPEQRPTQPSQSPSPTPAQTKTAVSGEFERLARRIIDAPHLFFVAGTRAGKTVLITELMRRVVDGGGKYVVIDGKPEMNWQAKWPGTKAKFYESARFLSVLTAVQRDMEKRMSYGAAKFPAYWLVIDECQRVTGTMPEAVDIIADILSRGAAFNVHVLLATQAATVAQIGFDGRMAVLENNASAYWLENDGQRTIAPARFSNGSVRPLSARYAIPNLPAPWAALENLPEFDDSGEFAPLAPLAPPAPVQSEDAPRLVTELFAPVQARTPVQEEPAPVELVARAILDALGEDGHETVIKLLASRSWSLNKIVDFVFGSKNAQRMEYIKELLNAQ